jgi:hypothetical protein
MTDRTQLVAYIATLATLAIIFIAALIAAAFSPSIVGKLESFALGNITGGLIGVLRMPAIRNQASTETGDVNVTPAPQPDPASPAAN